MSAPGERLRREDLSADAETIAQRLLGVTLVRMLPDGSRLAGRIVETEAYLGAQDKAAHSFDGRRTARNESMYARPGTAYVYFTYGMHFCMNVVCGREGEPVAALLRALEPAEGMDEMRRRRATKIALHRLRDKDLCSGPGKLCQALAIDRSLDGADLVTDDRLWLEWAEAPPPERVARCVRIGIAGAGEWAHAPLRWLDTGSASVSRRPLSKAPRVQERPTSRR